MSSVRAVGGRLLAGPRREHDDYVLCPTDRFFFRPAYTEGKCPLCGESAPGGAPPPPALLRIDSFALGMGVVGLVALAMTIVVVYMYTHA